MSSKKIGTHSGSFHADEALACYLLRNTNEFKGSGIIRSRDPEVLNKLDILVDVGGEYDPSRKRFDHHQKGFFETFSEHYKTKLSSAGLVYKHYGLEVVANILSLTPQNSTTEILYQKMYRNFVEAFDGIDNGINQFDTDQPPKYKNSTDLASRVGSLNPSWNEEDVDVQERFEQAVVLTGHEFKKSLESLFKSWIPARDIVVDAIDRRFQVHPSGKIIVLEKFAPWQDHLFEIEEERKFLNEEKPIYALFPESVPGGKNWRIRAIPPYSSTFECRKALPKEWRGLRDQELSKVANIENCIFVHISGFIGGNLTYEGALEMAKKALEID